MLNRPANGAAMPPNASQGEPFSSRVSDSWAAVGEAIDALDGAYGAILLANHGPVVAGRSLEEASHAIEELEQTARVHLLTTGRPLNLVPQSF